MCGAVPWGRPTALCPQVWWVLPDGQSVSLWYHCVALQHNALRCRELRANRESRDPIRPH